MTFIGESEPSHKTWADDRAKLLLEIKDAIEIACSKAKKQLEKCRQNDLLNPYDAIVVHTEQAIRGFPKVKIKQLSAQSLHKRLVKNKMEILRFMTDFRVPFDNNGSERDLRMLKLQQKKSGCFRTIEGVTAFCRIHSYLSSVAKAKQKSAYNSGICFER